MHLYTLIRGQKEKVESFIKHLETQYFSYQTGTTEQDRKMVQFGVRPIQLYEFAFPKEHLQEVLRTIQPKGFKGENKLSNIRKCMEKMVWVLRKMLKLQEVPEYDIKAGQRRITDGREWIDVRSIGIKDDKDAKIELV